jgi:ribosomal protein L11 methyltransferase
LLAIDNDEWSYLNAMENAERNSISPVDIRLGDVNTLDTVGMYDCVLANINRNVLVDDIPSYVKHLSFGGYLLLSGFYYEDIPVIDVVAESVGLKLIHTSTLNNWTCLLYLKSGQ